MIAVVVLIEALLMGDVAVVVEEVEAGVVEEEEAGVGP